MKYYSYKYCYFIFIIIVFTCHLLVLKFYKMYLWTSFVPVFQCTLLEVGDIRFCSDSNNMLVKMHQIYLKDIQGTHTYGMTDRPICEPLSAVLGTAELKGHLNFSEQRKAFFEWRCYIRGYTANGVHTDEAMRVVAV